MTSITTQPGVPAVVYLSSMLRDAVVDVDGKGIGTIADAIVRLGPTGHPHLTGLVAKVGQNRVFVPITVVSSIVPDRIILNTKTLDLRPFERRDGEVLLKEAVLGHRVIDVEHARLVRAYDVTLTNTPTGWAATGLDVHKRSWLPGSKHDQHTPRDWNEFDALIGHEASVKVRTGFGRLRGLRAAEIADIIESASTRERDDLLDHLHHHPDLEADVFEELQDTHQTQLLKTLSTPEIAAVLTRMRTDDAVDAIIDLPQDRRQPVIDALPTLKQADVMRLMRYQESSAGGLMGVEYLALGENATIAEVLDQVRTSTTVQPEALSTVYSTNTDLQLTGSLSLVRAIQADPNDRLGDIADPDPVHADPRDDMIDISNIMADYNLLTLPILDGNHRILGVITVDDALEAAIPEDWRRRARHQHATNQEPTNT
ncbi:magnesium transporter MgtE N-terminal domain-containing protein [Subtercola vilae]|uniref:Magnesium transporter n=1 Tax=Subtercola vilae TaxID=2056433 RepID=A0A4T2BQE3_9MICO|nr:CBS domain-containing protein [Subtercola vilae]TIH33883.1 magnesium transporter [Subtercola vilae]